jgi:hypothetical protein
LRVNLKKRKPEIGLLSQGPSLPVIQLALFTGGGNCVGSTQAPGAQELLINADVKTSPFGLPGGLSNQGDADQTESSSPMLPWPVESEAASGKTCELAC